MTKQEQARRNRRNDFVVPAMLAAAFVGLLVMERRRPLRERHESAGVRLVRNMATGAVAAALVAAPNLIATRAATNAVEKRRLGLLPRSGLPPAAQRWLGVALMDYTLYLWHILLHRVPFLWRSHRVHHADRDLDVSTALRFHVGELAWSIPWRVAQILLIGVPRRTLALWSRLTIAEVMFHHANLRLPARVESVLGAVVMTPARHGVHHDSDTAHQNSNYSSGLAAWDWLHGTVGPRLPQRSLDIGLPPPERGHERERGVTGVASHA